MPQPQMTVLEILNRTKVFFEKKGIPDARLDALKRRAFLMHVSMPSTSSATVSR